MCASSTRKLAYFGDAPMIPTLGRLYKHIQLNHFIYYLIDTLVCIAITSEAKILDVNIFRHFIHPKILTYKICGSAKYLVSEVFEA